MSDNESNDEGSSSSAERMNETTDGVDCYDLDNTLIQLNSSHPLYLHPNDHPGMLLVTEIMNFNSWKRSIVVALTAKNKLGLVTGLHKKPKINSKYLIHWDRCNSMIISWLLNSVSSEIRSSIVFIKNAKEIWDDLNARFSQSNAPQIFHVRKQIASLTQDNLSINAYFTRFRSLWDELSDLIPSPRCTCDASKYQEEYELVQKLTQFLMGLNDSYTTTRGQILMMTPLPTVSKAVSLLAQEEKQRTYNNSFGNSVMTTDLSTALVSKYNSGTSRNSYKKKGKFFCEHCHGDSHTKERSFFLNGYPDWHRDYGTKPDPSKMPRNKGKTVAHAVVQNHASSANIVTASSTNLSTAPAFTNAQYQQLLNLLNNNGLNSPESLIWLDSVQKKLKGIGRFEGGLYKLVLPGSTTGAFVSSLKSQSVVSPSYSSHVTSTVDSSVYLWHLRLSHSPLSSLKHLD